MSRRPPRIPTPPPIARVDDPAQPRSRPPMPSASGEHPAVQEYARALERGAELDERLRRPPSGGHPTLSMPIMQSEELREATREAPVPGEAEARARARGHTILVVDDDSAIRAALAELLVEVGGYVVFTAMDALDALNALDRMFPKPSLILLDVFMPVYDGWAFQGFVDRTQLAHIPRIIISAQDWKRQRPNRRPDEVLDPRWVYLDKHIAAGGETISKPVQPEAFLQTVARVIAKAGAG